MAKTDYKKKDKKVDLALLGEELGGRVPPQAIDIEEAVLGAILLEPDVVVDVLDQLSAECFYKDAHRKIYDAIATLSKRNDPVDILTVSDELRKRGDLDDIGGTAYLSQLTLKIGAAAHIDYHTKILLQKYIQRELISISYKIQKSAFDDSMTVDDLVDTAEKEVFELAERNMRRETSPIKDIIQESVDCKGRNFFAKNFIQLIHNISLALIMSDIHHHKAFRTEIMVIREISGDKKLNLCFHGLRYK